MFVFDDIPTTPSGCAFTGNPIFLEDKSSNDIGRHTFTIHQYGYPIYTGAFSYPLRCNIAEIADSVLPYFPEPNEKYPKFGPLVLLESMAEIMTRRITVTIDNTSTPVFSFFGFRGGVSKQNFRRLTLLDSDIFQSRLINWYTNCFLSTRTAEWRIVIKETELYPLYFITDTLDDEIEIEDCLSGKRLEYLNLEQGVYALDIDIARKLFWEKHGVLSNIFDIYHFGNFACRIVIENAATTKDRIRIKFRNSLGVFELVELTGTISRESTFDEIESEQYNQYDPVTDDYSERRSRIAPTKIININTGPINDDRARFILDMLCSNEVYILDLAIEPIMVIPSVENFISDYPVSTPKEFNIQLKFSDSDTQICEDISGFDDSKYKRVFTSQFDKQFN